MGSIYRRPKSPFWWVKYYQNGRAIRESTGTKKETVARRMLRVREGDVERGIPIDPKAGRITFEDAAADLLNDYQINGRRTLNNVKRRIELHLLPFFGGRRMSQIRTSDIRSYIARRQEQGVFRGTGEKRRRTGEVSPAEINRELAIVKRMFVLAIQGGKLHARPHIPMMAEADPRRGFFEVTQFQAVRDRLPGPLRPVVTFAYLTGWRIPSEVLSLEWRQVDLDRGAVRLDPGTTKNGRGRLLPFGEVLPELADLLKQQQREHDDLARQGVICPFVFQRDGKRIKSFRGAWKGACRLAGCPGRIPHDFRRTAVRNLTRAGVPERIAMQITGHKTRSVFDRYDIVNEADIREGLRKLGAAVMGTLPGTSARSAAGKASAQPA